MPPDYPLRLYANPLKLLAYLALSLPWFVIGMWLVRNPETTRGNATIAGYVGIIFGGLCTVVFLAMMVIYGVVRRPLLEITASGWRAHPLMPLLTSQEQMLDWHDIGRINISHQRMARGRGMFYLSVHAREPGRLPRPRSTPFSSDSVTSCPAGLLIMLNPVFLRPTPAKCEALLKCIQTTCTNELHLYDVEVITHVQAL